MSIKTLELNIQNLCKELRKTGKVDPANYYESLLSRIKSPSDEIDRDEALQQIISSGKISDMVNFSMEEDRRFDLVYEEAKKLKKWNPKEWTKKK